MTASILGLKRKYYQNRFDMAPNGLGERKAHELLIRRITLSGPELTR